MREKLLHLKVAHHALSRGNGDGGHGREGLGEGLRELFGHLRVRSVTGLHGDDVAHDAFSAEHEIADDVEDLVTGEFLGVSHRLLAHHRIALHDDSVLEAAAFDEPFLEEGLDVFVEHEGPRVGNLLLIGLGSDLGGKVLGHAPVRPHLGAGDTEALVGDDREDRSPLGFEVNGFADLEDTAVCLLLDDAGFLDAIDEGARRTITDRRLVRIHLDDGVVHPHANEG